MVENILKKKKKNFGQNTEGKRWNERGKNGKKKVDLGIKQRKKMVKEEMKWREKYGGV